MGINVAARVRYHAEDQALSMGEVARRCGWQTGKLSMTLKTNNPTVKTLETLAAALGVTVADLVS